MSSRSGRRGRGGWRLFAALIGLIGAGLFWSATPPGAAWWLGWLESPWLRLEGNATDPAWAAAQAIVVLGSGTHTDPRTGFEVMGRSLNRRIARTIALARATGLPVAVSGKDSPEAHEASLMVDALRRAGIVPTWVDRSAISTDTNACGLASRLLPAGVRRILLVTSASHMDRAMWVFGANGFDSSAVPTDFLAAEVAARQPGWRPNRASWYYARVAFHEFGGMLWYRLAACTHLIAPPSPTGSVAVKFWPGPDTTSPTPVTPPSS